jgi:RNA polymerase sigma factor (sigma-70 family)
VAERPDFEKAFVDQLPWIDRVVGLLARRHGIVGDERADIESWVRLKLVEEDYRVFRCFRGESSITTYLTTVVSMLFRDYRAQRWGRWRPSAAAVRQGPLAVRLERLVMRDGLKVAEAGEMLRTSGETNCSDLQLTNLLSSLPRRSPMRPIMEGDAPLATMPETDAPADPALIEESKAHRRGVEVALKRALAALPPEDQLILRMHYWQSLSVADIARALGLEQRPMYRRLNRLHGELLRRLVAEGISKERLRELLDESAA